MLSLVRLLAPLLCLGLLASANVQADTLSRIGVLAFRGDDDARKRWTPTANYLSAKTPGVKFVVEPLNLDEIGVAVAERKVDFVLTNTGNYVDLESRYGISRIATLKNLRQGQGYTQFGAVIFTRADHPSVKTLADIKGLRFAAVSREAFGGFQMAWREMLEHNINPFSDLADLRFLGFPQDNIVYAVLTGEVDAGTVRTDTMERMQQEGKIDLAEFRILNRKSTEGFPFVHSTRLYPEWPFSKARHTPEALAEHVAVALLNLPGQSDVARSAKSVGWTIPLDYGSVHNMFKALKIGPYEYLDHVTLARLWAEYRDWILLLTGTALLLMLAITWVLRANRRMAISEQNLREEVRQRENAQRQLAAHRDSLEQRVAERTKELEQVNMALEQDITARRRAEEALRRSDKTLRALHDITVSTADFDFKVTELLNLGCRHFNLEIGALVQVEGQSCTVLEVNLPTDAYRKGDRLSVEDTFCAMVLGSGEPITVPDIEMSKYKSHPVFRELGQHAYLGVPVLVDKQPYGTLNFSSAEARTEPFPQVDIDILLLLAQWIGGEIERIHAHERLQNHQIQMSRVARHNTMGEMASGIAHELNQPLTAIINYSRGCLRRLRNSGREREDLVVAIEKVSSEAERAGQIIKRLREFVTLGELRQENTSVEDILSTVSELAAPELRQYNVRLKIDPTLNTPQVKVDRIQIEQVLLNLLRNAIDAVQANLFNQRDVNVRVTYDEKYVFIKVQDNGPGIDQERLGQVFDPFFTTKPDGMGLGLAISRSVVEAHRGKLSAQSASGKGTVFECKLPIRPVAEHREMGSRIVQAALGT